MLHSSSDLSLSRNLAFWEKSLQMDLCSHLSSPLSLSHPSFVQYLGESIFAPLMTLQRQDTDHESENIQFTSWFARDNYVVQICFICI